MRIKPSPPKLNETIEAYLHHIQRVLLTKGFTLVELMVIIIIVGILAGIAVPLYLNYTETAKVREALGIMKAIITSQKVEKMRTLRYYTATGGNAPTTFLKKGVDMRESRYFTYEASGDPDAFSVTATATPESHMTGTISYDSATNTWSSTGDITESMLPGATD